MAQELNDFVAGWVGGATGIIVGQPMDTLKVRFATNSGRNLSMIKTTMNMIKNEGVLSLFKGTMAPSLGYGLCTGIQFYGCQISNRFFVNILKCSSRRELPMRYIAISGGALTLCPAELIKIQLQSSTKKMSNMEIVKHIWERKGVTGFFKGISAQFWRDTLGFAVYYGVYEYMLRLSSNRDSPYAVLNAGGITGMISWAAVYPIDAVKSKMQATPFKPDVGWDKYKGFVNCFRVTYQKEGMKGLFKGFMPCFLRAYPVNAVTFFVYEYSLRLLMGEFSSTSSNNNE